MWPLTVQFFKFSVCGLYSGALNSLEIMVMTNMKFQMKRFKMQRYLTSLKYTICAICIHDLCTYGLPKRLL